MEWGGIIPFFLVFLKKRCTKHLVYESFHWWNNQFRMVSVQDKLFLMVGSHWSPKWSWLLPDGTQNMIVPNRGKKVSNAVFQLLWRERGNQDGGLGQSGAKQTWLKEALSSISHLRRPLVAGNPSTAKSC